MLQLHEFQEKQLAEARGLLRIHKRIVIQGSTGSGKTILSAFMTRTAASRGYRIWFNVHRRELVQQSASRFDQVGLGYGIIANGWPANWHRSVQICSVQTLARRLTRLQAPGLMIWDECITGDSLIDTDVGRIRIDDVPYYKPSHVLSWNGTAHIWRRITAWRHSGVRSVKKIMLCSGRHITGTDNHPLYTQRGWLPIGEITLGDRILCSPKESANIFSGHSSEIHLSGSLTKEVHRHDSHPTIQQNKQNGPFIRRANLKDFILESVSSITLAMVKGLLECRLHVCLVWRTFMTSLKEAALSESVLIGLMPLEMLDLHGGTATMAVTNMLHELPDSIRKDTEKSALALPLPGLKIVTARPTYIGTSEDIGRRVFLWRALKKCLRILGATSRSKCDISWEIVVSILDCSEQDTYDISVDGTHCFFANGVLTHNCHHVAAKTWATIFKTFPDATHIGLSATPSRLDGKGLGDYFEAMCCGPSTKWLIDNGFLVPYRLFSVPGVSTEGMHHLAGDFNRKEVVAALEKSTVTGDAVKHYCTHAMGRRALVFEASRERSERCAQAFRDAGIPAAHVDGETDPGVRDRAMRDIESGALRVLCNVDLFGEGVDVPAIEAVFLCRPTDSLTVYLQQVGRGLRTCQGKEDVLIFDHAGNAHRHGRPDDEREWKLTRTPIKEKEQDNGVAVRQCPYCYAVSPRAATVCVDCKQPFPVNGREITDADGQLVEDPIIAERRKAREDQARADSLEKLEELGRMRGYKNPAAWAKYVFDGRGKKRAGRAA